MKSEFVSTAAHELHTPLATIIGYTDLLLSREDQTHENLNDYLQLIQNKAERLADIVGDLLDISWIESGEVLQLNPEPCRLDTLCQNVLTGYQIQSKSHRFSFDLPQDLPIEIHADRYAFRQILENVLSNAVKYSPDGGEIFLTAYQEDGYCRLSISDQGIGMTPDQLEKIYDKFYRVDATNTAISGTGLGMTIVRYLIEAQAGEVCIDSVPDQGPTVHLRMPLDPSARPGFQ
jgi:signal transduction histidine kinase